jgi:DNA-binding protein YbaB
MFGRMRTDVQARITAMLTEYRATRSRIEGLQATARAMRVSARSPDRCVTATVDVSGELRELSIDPAVAARLDSTVLAQRVVGACRLAAAQARERLRVAMRDALPEQLHDLVASDGSVDLAAVLPAALDQLRSELGASRV